MFDADSLLQDETRDTYTFEAREIRTIKMPYSRPPQQKKVQYSMAGSHYTQPHQNVSINNYRPPQQQRPHFSNSFIHKAIPTRLTPNFHNTGTTPTINSFSSFHNKYSPPQTPQYSQRPNHSFTHNDGPYPRYPKNNNYRKPVTPYQPPRQHGTWWKKILRRSKRQISLETALCPSRSTYIMPRAAQSVNGDWMFLVNLDDQYTQLVKSETCIQNTCQGGCDVPDGFTAICQQQYAQKRLVALDGSGSKLNSDTFWFPSCCICRLRAIGV